MLVDLATDAGDVSARLTSEGLMAVDALWSRWVRLAGGDRCHYVTSGADGANVVMLHGGTPGCSGTAGWWRVAPALAERGLRVFCPDLPGFGLSGSPNDAPLIDVGRHVDFVEEFCTALCLDRIHVVGSSWGSIVAAHYVLAHPGRVRSFALLGGALGDLTGDPLARPLADLAPAPGTPARSAELTEMCARAAERHVGPYDEFTVTVARRRAGERDPDACVRLALAGRLDQMTVPGIAVWGVDDVTVPMEVVHAQEDACPNIQFFYVEGAGRDCQADQPAIVAAVLGELFCSGQISATTAAAAGASRRRPWRTRLVGAGGPDGDEPGDSAFSGHDPGRTTWR